MKLFACTTQLRMKFHLLMIVHVKCAYEPSSTHLLRGYIFQELLLTWFFSCINKNCFLSMANGCMNNLYISHRSLYAQNTAFGQSAACLSVFFGLTPFAILWHAENHLHHLIIRYSVYRRVQTRDTICDQVYNLKLFRWTEICKCFEV